MPPCESVRRRCYASPPLLRSARLVRSAATTSTVVPNRVSRDRSAFSRLASLATSSRLAPRVASKAAVCAPIPPVAPVSRTSSCRPSCDLPQVTALPGCEPVGEFAEDIRVEVVKALRAMGDGCVVVRVLESIHQAFEKLHVFHVDAAMRVAGQPMPPSAGRRDCCSVFAACVASATLVPSRRGPCRRSPPGRDAGSCPNAEPR